MVAKALSCLFQVAETEEDGQRAARSGMGMELHYNPLPKPSQHCSKPRLISLPATAAGRILAGQITSSVIAIRFTFRGTPRNTAAMRIAPLAVTLQF